MQCYTELTAPTAVTHAVVIPFLSADSKNLIVAKGSLLQIFKTKQVPAELDSAQQQAASNTNGTGPSTSAYHTRRDGDDNLESALLADDTLLLHANKGNNTKLVLVAEYPLSGTICGIVGVKILHSKSGGHALLVGLRTAKACLVQWNPETASLHDTSVHYFESEEGASFDLPLSDYETILESDPGSRCVAMKFGSRSLAILPFKQAGADIGMDEEDWDEELDGPRPVKDGDKPTATLNVTAKERDYMPSFVLRFPQIEPELLFVQHFAFLHEYREPTFGVLSSKQQPTYFLGRRDIMSYKVFTLDLQQQASTAILSVDNLPQDLQRVIPLPAPIGGALLLGDNELVHVDQSGKATGVGVNQFAKECTSFPLADQSNLGLGLENCTIEQLSLETGEMLMVLSSGEMAIINFRLDGRTVSGITISRVPVEAGGDIIPSGISCLAKLDKQTYFVGSATSDSYIMGWSRRHSQTGKKKSRALDEGIAYDLDDLELDDDDEDDLYGDSTEPGVTNGTSGTAKLGDLTFRIHDTLLSLAPIREIVPAQKVFFPDSEELRNAAGVVSQLELAVAVGRGRAGAIAVLNRHIQPKVIGRFSFPEARGIWTMPVQKPVPKALQGDRGVNAAAGKEYLAAQYDKLMIVAKVDLDGYETSDVYALTAAGFEALTGTEFDPAAGFTVEAGTMGNHMRVIQVLKSEIRCYDGDLNMQQIVPMLDEETGAEPRIVSASIADPYLLLVRDDSSIWIAQIDSSCELEEMDRSDEKLLSNKWLTACLYTDSEGHFGQGGSTDKPTILAFLVNAAGALYIYRLPDLSKPIYVAECLAYIPPFLSADYATRRGTVKETLAELLVADLGDTTYKSPYMILRNGTDDLTIYEPVLRREKTDYNETLAFKKIRNSELALSPEVAVQDDAAQQDRFVPLRACSNIGGYSTVFLPGSSPSFLIKNSKGIPRVIGLCGTGVRGMSSFHTEGCDGGFIYADSKGIARVTQLPPRTSFSELGISVQKVPLGFNVKQIAFHPTTHTYVLGTSVLEDFELPKDEDHHKEWARENIAFKPQVERGHIRLVNPITWTVIQDIEMDPFEDILCLKTLNLEVSEMTKERRMLVVIGTGTRKGEDLPIRGRIYVYDVAIVIPEAGRPETNKRLKLVAKEDIPRGAVTAISEIGTQGLMLVAQGQKCMVRGLKEDGSLLPVAFMDMSCYVVAAKELKATGLCVMADAAKGVWFTGCTEEPYRMQLFGKSTTKMECVTADFLPDGKFLFLVVSDTSGDVHILQYDPEHPRSLQGHLLLHRTTFSTASNAPHTSILLPRYTRPTTTTEPHTNGTTTSSSSTPGTLSNHLLLTASQSGMLSAITPLTEAAYRRLLSLSSQLINSLPTVAATNPRAHRTPHPDALPVGVVDSTGGRAVIDGAVLARWNELGSGRRAELVGKAGYEDVEGVRNELDGLLGWKGLGYY